MLSRTIDLGLYDELTGEQRVNLADFTKLAAVDEIKDFIAKFKPDSHFMYLHVIAMGAGEYYGCNKNADYFPESYLQLRHKTFEQQAKVFEEHDNKPSSPSYGFVPISWYNQHMHRVELVLAVDREKGAKFVRRVESGEQLEVSMGCRIAYDVCSICGNHAKKKSDYCTHIQMEKRKILSDGRQVYMINVNPTFFDISIVKRRADRIAYVLDKVASYDDGLPSHVEDVSDAWEAVFTALDKQANEKQVELEGIASKAAALIKQSDMYKQIPAMSPAEKLNKGMEAVLPEVEQLEPDLPVPMLDKMALTHTIGEILSTFLSAMIPMKPREFARVVVVNRGMPIHMYPHVLHAIENAPDEGEFQMVRPQEDMYPMLAPFMRMRSSYGPHVLARVLAMHKLAEAQEAKTASYHMDPAVMQYRDSMPNMVDLGYSPMHAGYASQHMASIAPMHYNQRYSTMPVVYNPEEYQRRMQSAPLRKPMNPLGVAATMGMTYAAYRGAKGIGQLVQNITGANTAGMGGLGLLAALVGIKGFTSLFGHKADSYDPYKTASELFTENEKTAAGNFTKYVVAPFVGAHLASAHYRRKFYNGDQLNSAQRFVAENPDFLSLAAPVVAMYGKGRMAPKKIASFDVFGSASTGAVITGYPEYDEYITKLADFGDVLANAAIPSIIFRGRGMSGGGAFADAMVDSLAFQRAGDISSNSAKPLFNRQLAKPKIPRTQ